MSGIRDEDRVNMMDENPELRWSFVHKVYSITIFQLLLTIAVVSILLFVPPIAKFFNNYYVLFTIVFFALLLVEYHHQKHPLCYFLLLIFTVSLALPLGLFCVDFLSGKITLEAVALNTGVVVFILTLYTFWAVKRGRDFDFLYPLLSRASLVLFLIIVVEILLPLGMFSIYWCFFMIIGCLLFIIFCGNIVYDTDTLIKRYSYAKYISVSITLYLEVIILFLSLCILYFIAQSDQIPLLQRKESTGQQDHLST